MSSWLLHQWDFPEKLCLSVRYSDDPNSTLPETKDPLFFQCVAFSRLIADLSVSPVSADELYDTSEKVESCLKLAPLAFLEIFKKVTELVWQSQLLFEIDYQKNYNPETIIERARELRTMLEIKVGQQINAMAAKI